MYVRLIVFVGDIYDRNFLLFYFKNMEIFILWYVYFILKMFIFFKNEDWIIMDYWFSIFYWEGRFEKFYILKWVCEKLRLLDIKIWWYLGILNVDRRLLL